MLVKLTRTFITLSLLGELGEVDRIFMRLGHVVNPLRLKAKNITCMVTCYHVVCYVSDQNRAKENMKPFYLSPTVKKIHLV